MTQLPQWGELTTEAIGALESARTVAVLPVAAIEQHGPHLPLATDAILLEEILRRTAARLGDEQAHVLALPMQCIGHSLEHTTFPGTLHAGAETLIASWCAIGASVARAGIRKLAIVNSHGGQPQVVDLVALRLRAEHALLVTRALTLRLGSPPGLFDAHELEHGLHGGEVETSMMLACRPDLVGMDRAMDFDSKAIALARRCAELRAEGDASFAWMAEDLHPSGATGRAAAADATRGAQQLDHVATRLAGLLRDLVRVDTDQVLSTGGRG